MATALARGCGLSGLVNAGQLTAADPNEESRQQFASQVPGALLIDSNQQVVAGAGLLVLAVKPQVMPEVLADIAGSVTPRHLVVSIAAGVTLAKLAAGLPAGTRLVRVMPNTPCLVGEGASCFCRGQMATEEDGKVVRQMLESVGEAHEVDETMLDAVTGLSGSGPAFVYSAIEAMAAGGTAMGLPPKLALQLATQTARGAAEMLLSTGESPDELRQQVTSPGGTTLAGLETLKKLKGNEAFRAAVEAATHRSIELGA